eukprot:CAMPEP_0194284684 /NCGR_PEP_ID=MMETSP0169-20130528/28312_1 /TAXON_ID=218684 /ORGANISM="Corethron pennatum, Strain L29A3" /LENGTH=214 /DNA_ID=CAMNT_0039030577 /DNA_START=130 /DNA_END=771 /DNA_ORIENTATION=+
MSSPPPPNSSFQPPYPPAPLSPTHSHPYVQHPPPSMPDGQILRLHLRCTAPLPIGAVLRITDGSTMGSSLGNSSGQTSAEFPTPGVGDGAGIIEMVTSPSEYPVWRTRTPVVVRRGAREHRYRYQVHRPGAGVTGPPAPKSRMPMGRNVLTTSFGSTRELDGSRHGAAAPGIVEWEDPFAPVTSGRASQHSSRRFRPSGSAQSLGLSGHGGSTH